MKRINSFKDFCKSLRQAGFSTGSGNDEGVFSVIPFTWNELPPPGCALRWHTGEPDTDPWQWRLRVLDECDDIAYAKVFSRKSGYVTAKWYPYFLAARRDEGTLEERYRDGLVSREAKRIYDVICENHALPVDEIKRLGGFKREDKSRFDKALVDLQMGLYVTMCGHSRKLKSTGEAYGWNAMLYCTTEAFFGEEVFKEAAKLGRDAAVKAITEQIYALNSSAEEKRVRKYIFG